MTSLRKRIIAASIVFVMVLSAVPAPAQAATTEELQAQIAALQAQLNALLAQLSDLGGTTTPTGNVPAACSGITFNTNLMVGSVGNDVKCLQALLNTDSATKLADSGAGSPGNETTYFGNITKAGVIKFQEKYASEVLATYGLTAGTGYFGTTSRAKANAILAAGTTTPEGGCTSDADCGTGYVCTSGACVSVVAPVSGLSVSLAGSDPVSRSSAMGAQDVRFSTYRVVAGTQGAVTVNSVTVHRGSIAVGAISADADYTNVKLYRNSISPANKLGATLTLNTTTHSAKFSNLNWTINAGQTDTLIVTGSLATSGITGNVMMLGLDIASDVVLSGAETVSGTFPSYGTKVMPAGTAVGQFDLDVLDTPANLSPLSGSTDQGLATLEFESETEDFRLDSVKITQIGSAIPADLSNITLKYGTVVLATIPQLGADNTGTFEIVAPNSENVIKAGQTRKFWVYVDIAAGITTGRTIDISVQQASDVVAIGATSGGAVTLLSDVSGGGTAYSADSGAAHTISIGSYTAAISPAYNPSATSYIVGSENDKVTAIRFSATNSEAVRITQLTITEGDDISYTDVSAVRLTAINTDGTIGATLAEGVLTSSETVQFGVNEINAYDSDYLFEVPKGSNYDVYIVVDIPTGADTNDGMKFSIAANADVKADGVMTQNDLAACTSCTATGNIHEIDANGTVTFSSSPTTAADAYVKGSQDKEFARFSATVSDGEDITVSAITLTAVSAANTPHTTANSPTDVRLYKESVAPANLLGTVASPATGVANFSFNDVIAKGTSRTYIVTADIPTTTGAAQIGFEIILETDVTATGNSSGATGIAVTDGTYSVDSNFMTVAQGTLGVIASSLPVYSNITEKSNNLEVARFVVASGANGETVRLSMLKLTMKGTAGSNLAPATTDVSSLVLYDVNGGAIVSGGGLTKTVSALTSGAATFSGLTIDVPTGEQRVLGLKINLGDSAYDTPYVVFGVENYYTDVVASGLESGATVYANQLVHATSGVLATLFAASAVDDTDLTANVVDADDELSEYAVPALGITAVGNGDVIQIESEKIFVTTASDGTVVRSGFAETTAAAHSTTGVPIQLVVGGYTVSEGTNDWTTHTGVSLVAASTMAATVRAGMLVVDQDAAATGSEDDIKLVTAVSSDGTTLTIIDAFDGAAYTEDTDDDAYLISLTNYGQAQKVQGVGTLTLAVGSGTPAVAQAVAGTSNVSFTEIKLTAAYEPVGVTKMVFTRTGGRDTDFASVYLQNLTDPTWGPNGNGKSNPIQVIGGKATFNFASAYAIGVDYNAANGTSVMLVGNLNTVATGVVSTDAPKFYLAALNTTNLTATGASTGTALSSFTAGTPTPVTSANINSQVIYKGKLDLTLNSSSPSGSGGRKSTDTILILDAVSASNGSVATFRAATAADDDSDPTEVAAGDTEIVVDTTKYVDGGTSIEINDSGPLSANDGFLIDLGTTGLVSGNTRINFWLQWDNAAAADLPYDDIQVCFSDDAATFDHCAALPVSGETDNNYNDDMWFNIDMALSDIGTAVTADQYVGIKVADVTLFVAGDTTDALYIDGIHLYTDKIIVGLASGNGLFDIDGANTNTAVLLKADGATVATGYYDADSVTNKVISGQVSFFPTSQFTVPTSGKTLSVVADTTTLITGTGTGKTLTATIDLGSANHAGTVTAGEVWWYDESATSTIKWVDSAQNPLTGGTISY